MKKNAWLLITALILAAPNFAQPALVAKHYNIENKLAIEGYDPVAYFTQKKAVEGNKQFNAISDGVIYYFSSAANRDLFIKNPAQYKPEYGGWCAYAMGATNEKVSVDPETFKIINGKLYLFYHSFFNNTLDKWNKAEAALKSKADKNWAAIFK